MRSLRFSIAATLACMAAPLTAQQTGALTGTVTAAESGAPLEGVRVLVEGTVLATTTSPRGVYRLNDVPAGARVVIVRGRRRGAERHSVTIPVGQTTMLDLALKETVTALNEVVSTATREEEHKSDTPATIDAIGRETIDQTRPIIPPSS